MPLQRGIRRRGGDGAAIVLLLEAPVLASELPIDRDAFPSGGPYRYRLWRRWNPDQPVMVWVKRKGKKR
jgi:hypothetical protein